MFYARLFSILGFLGVTLGAFGAHLLKNKVTEIEFEHWKTATLYLFVHTLAGLMSCYFSHKKRSQFLFAFGCIVFSGSLYFLVILKMPIFGAITPIGGVAFLLGWLFLTIDISKNIK